MVVQIKSSINALNVHDKGSSAPAWFGDYANKNKWGYDGVPASGATNGFYWHEDKQSPVSSHYYVQYGQNTEGWASARFIDEVVTVTSEELLDGGKLHVVGNVHIGAIATYKTDHFIKGVAVNYTVKVGGAVIHSHGGQTGDEYLQLPNPDTVTFDVTIDPQSYSDVTALTMDWVYPNGEYPNAHFVIGASLYNPTLPNYQPDTAYNGSSWVKQDDAGHGAVYDGSKWVEVPSLPLNKQNQVNAGSGYNYYNGSQWLQSPLP